MAEPLIGHDREIVECTPEGTQFCYKFDIRKFYESVDQDVLKQCVRRVFKDGRLIQMLDGFITMMPEGISIGLRSSQGLGRSAHRDAWFVQEPPAVCLVRPQIER